MASAAGLLKCSLCLSDFTDPRALPCLHTFCLKCLIDLSDANQQAATLKCPMCQEHHKMPRNGAGGFRKDFRINSFMEINRNKEHSVRTTMCKRHPKMELTHVCAEADCNRAVVCTQCAAESHVHHLAYPIKSFCEYKLSELKLMKKATQQNRVLMACAHSSSEVVNMAKKQIKKFHARLNQLEKEITGYVLDNRAEVEHDRITERDGQLQEIESQLERLEAQLSDTVPNIVRKNVYNEHLIEEFHRLQETLNNWSLSYSLVEFQADAFQLAHDFTLPMNNDFIKTLPRQDVKGASVGLLGRTVPPVKAEEIVTWKQRDDDVLGIACHSYVGGGVTILSSLYFSVYMQNEGYMFHSHEHKDHADRVTTFQEYCQAILDPKCDKVRLFYAWPIFLYEINDHAIRIRGKAGCGLSGTNNYLVYSAWRKSTKSQIVCFSVKKHPPKFQWIHKFGSFTLRSLSALESPKELLVVVAADSCQDRKKAAALIAVNGPSKPLWKITFEALDREAEEFDLRDMCNDGRYFYVLNTEEGCVHVISTDGNVLSKILQNLDRPRSLACNSERNELVVACSGRAVKVYKLIYRDRP